jgi:hypothetical protein
MEILRFDSRRPSARYSSLVEAVCERMADVLVVACPAPAVEFDETRESFAPGWMSSPELAYGV